MADPNPQMPQQWRCQEHGAIETGGGAILGETKSCPFVDAQGRLCGMPLYSAFAEADPNDPPGTAPLPG